MTSAYSWRELPYLGERFEAILNRKGLRVSVAPLICLSSEHAEALSAYLPDTRLTDLFEAHIRANRAKSARYLTMPFFATTNSVMKGRTFHSQSNGQLRSANSRVHR